MSDYDIEFSGYFSSVYAACYIGFSLRQKYVQCTLIIWMHFF